MNGEQLKLILKRIVRRIEAEKDFLTELDNVIGDGDHGINLARGFAAVDAKLEAPATPGALCKTVGMTLISTVGGASGPLYGTAFLRLSMAFGTKEDISFEDFLAGLQGAIEGISQRGRSHQGEKTMLDAMIPALEAMKTSEEKSTAGRLDAAVRAAREGVELTKTYAATKGRASYVGERSIGHQDPGATSFTQMLEEAAAGVREW